MEKRELIRCWWKCKFITFVPHKFTQIKNKIFVKNFKNNKKEIVLTKNVAHLFCTQHSTEWGARIILYRQQLVTVVPMSSFCMCNVLKG